MRAKATVHAAQSYLLQELEAPTPNSYSYSHTPTPPKHDFWDAFNIWRDIILAFQHSGKALVSFPSALTCVNHATYWSTTGHSFSSHSHQATIQILSILPALRRLNCQPYQVVLNSQNAYSSSIHLSIQYVLPEEALPLPILWMPNRWLKCVCTPLPQYIYIYIYIYKFIIIIIIIHVAAACDRGCSVRSWLTGHRDGTKDIEHEGAGVA